MIKLGNTQKGIKTSSFWLDPIYFQGSSYATTEERESSDLLKMSSIRRSIANFVKIVTGKNIPVKFKSAGMSATDGKTVVISSDLSKFDTVCGLALHEGSHILLSNFKLLEKLHDNPMQYFSTKFKKEMAIKYNMSENDVCHKILGPRVKSFCNYVEDRRIDNYIYTHAPGYQGYYESMYEEYWNSPKISEGLLSNMMRDEVWESYEFRVINLTSSDTDIDALKGLREIYKIIDLSNIDRLKNSDDALKVAVEVMEVIEKYITPSVPNKNDAEAEEVEEGEGNGQSKKSDKSSEDGETEESESKSTVGSPNNNSEQRTPKTPPPLMTDEDIEALLDAIEKQKKFLDGKVEQKELSEEKKGMIDAMEEAGTEQKEVAKGSKMLDGCSKSCSTIVMKEFNHRILKSDPFGIFQHSPYGEEEVKKGFALGRQLGKKLQIRNEERTLKTTRLRNGKMDDRLIHSLGYGAEQVFERTFTDSFNPLHLHISIDASGSMSGSKWNKTQIAVVAIAVAASMVNNLNVVISYRYTATTKGSHYRYSDHKPLILIAYDSRKDDVTKIKQLFPYLNCPSATPEGLCFEAILDYMVAGSNTQDSYFINFSDGEPYFSNREISYSGDSARKHTRKMMEAFRGRGIKILSYFIGSGHGSSLTNFKDMYGKDAVNVEVTNLIPLAKTLNKLFVQK